MFFKTKLYILFSIFILFYFIVFFVDLVQIIYIINETHISLKYLVAAFVFNYLVHIAGVGQICVTDTYDDGVNAAISKDACFEDRDVYYVLLYLGNKLFITYIYDKYYAFKEMFIKFLDDSNKTILSSIKNNSIRSYRLFKKYFKYFLNNRLLKKYLKNISNNRLLKKHVLLFKFFNNELLKNLNNKLLKKKNKK